MAKVTDPTIRQTLPDLRLSAAAAIPSRGSSRSVSRAPGSLAATQKTHLIRPQLWLGEATSRHRIFGDDTACRFLVGRLEDPDPGINPATRRTRHDQHSVSKQACEPLGVFAKRSSFLLAHRCREVIPWRMKEVDPLGHPLRIVGNQTAVNQLAQRRRLRGLEGSGSAPGVQLRMLDRSMNSSVLISPCAKRSARIFLASSSGDLGRPKLSGSLPWR